MSLTSGTSYTVPVVRLKARAIESAREIVTSGSWATHGLPFVGTLVYVQTCPEAVPVIFLA